MVNGDEPIDLWIQPSMLSSAGFRKIYLDFSLQYRGRSINLHFKDFKGSLQEALARALRESGEAPYLLTTFPKKFWHPEDEYAIRLRWKAAGLG